MQSKLIQLVQQSAAQFHSGSSAPRGDVLLFRIRNQQQLLASDMLLASKLTMAVQRGAAYFCDSWGSTRGGMCACSCWWWLLHCVSWSWAGSSSSNNRRMPAHQLLYSSGVCSLLCACLHLLRPTWNQLFQQRLLHAAPSKDVLTRLVLVASYSAAAAAAAVNSDIHHRPRPTSC